jgi:hypothetical protein
MSANGTISKLTIGELVERAQRGEDLQLPRSTHDVFARLECLVIDWQQGAPLSQEDYDFLMEYVLASPMLQSFSFLFCAFRRAALSS